MTAHGDAVLDRFFGPRQPNRSLIRHALRGASHVLVHAYDNHRVMVKKRGCRFDTRVSPVVQEECRLLIEQEGRSEFFRLLPRSGKNGATMHWLPQPKRLSAQR